MRTSRTFLAALLVFGCSESDPAPGPGNPTSSGPDAGYGDAGPQIPILQGGRTVRVLPGNPGLVGITSDEHLITRDGTLIMAAPLVEGAKPTTIVDTGRVVLIRGSVVFVWSDVDYETGLGELLVWSAAGGAHALGRAPFAEDSVAASDDGRWVMYLQNTNETTADLVISDVNFQAPQTLVSGMGRGGQDTCRPNYRFVGDRAFVAWCPPGSRDGAFQRFLPPSGGGPWSAEMMAQAIQPRWDSDQTGDRVIYITNGSQAIFVDGKDSVEVDNSVGWATLLPDGSAALYRVGDQLRRSPLPEVDPEPVVTTNFRLPVAFTPSYDHVVYSTAVVYEEGERRDLYLADTTGFNPQPLVLASDPSARLPAAPITTDGGWLLYYDELRTRAEGATLNARRIGSEESLSFPNVYDAKVARDGLVVISDNRSNPDQWPVVADLKLLDLSADAGVAMIEERVIDGSAFFVGPDGDRVIYLRSGVDAEGHQDRDAQGVYMMVLPDADD